ncbi:MAG: hypothetical protein AAB682_02845 [Patescibacteria group bacterium]
MQNKLEPKYLFPIFLLCLIVGSAVVFASHTVRGIFDFNNVTTKVFLPPRMSDADMRFITEYLPDVNRIAAEGLTVYNTDTDSLNYWNGSAWRSSVDPDAGSAIPSASVVMWYGPDLPADGKWKYCNGTNTNGGAYAYDTPNMIGRFPRGASADSELVSPADVGGKSEITFAGLNAGWVPGGPGSLRVKALTFIGSDGVSGNRLCIPDGYDGRCVGNTSIKILPPYLSLYYICMI